MPRGFIACWPDEAGHEVNEPMDSRTLLMVRVRAVLELFYAKLRLLIVVSVAHWLANKTRKPRHSLVHCAGCLKTNDDR
jgi:hypothetical protein